MVATAVQVARRWLSSTNERSARTPANSSSMTSEVVSRTSQSHQTPQVARAQIEPWTSSRALSTAPTSMAPVVRASQRRLPVHSPAMAKTKAAVKQSMAIQALGTWTYMIRWTWPI